MSPLVFAASLLTFCAVGCIINQATVRWPTALAMSVIATLMASVIALLGHAGIISTSLATNLVAQVNFPQFLLHGVLSVLLFAGALSLDSKRLRDFWAPIFRLATMGTFLSALISALLLWGLSQLLKLPVPLPWCLLFGAVIAPTDPIAVLSMLQTSASTPALRAKLAGESLFNDGMALLMFTVVLEWVTTNDYSGSTILWEFLVAPFLGGGLGWAIGRLACIALARTAHRPTQSLITLALATGTWVLAERFGLSAPIAEVAAGLVVGARVLGMAAETCDHINSFWETVDEVTNAAMFALMGLELLVLPITPIIVIMGMLAWAAVLLGRTIGVAVSLRPTPKHWARKTGLIGVMSWAGLRGGMSLALALSLPPGPEARLLAAVTFLVVALSIMVQGLSLPWVLNAHARHLAAAPKAATPKPSFEDESSPVSEAGALPQDFLQTPVIDEGKAFRQPGRVVAP